MTEQARLPRGPHALPRAAVEGSQRRRIVEATARLVARDGYAKAKVAEIARLAGVSPTTIYALFADKEQVFLACYQAGSDTHRAMVEHALETEGPAEQRLRAAIGAYLRLLDDDLDLARAFFVEAQHATPRLRDRFLTNQDSYVELFERWHAAYRAEHPGAPRVPRELWLGVVAGIVGLVTRHIHRAGVGAVEGTIVDDAVALVLAVTRGAQE